MFYTMADAKRDFSMGHLAHFSLERAQLETGWCVLLSDDNAAKRRYPLVDARTKTARVFRTLDAAINAIEDIGFKVDYLTK